MGFRLTRIEVQHFEHSHSRDIGFYSLMSGKDSKPLGQDLCHPPYKAQGEPACLDLIIKPKQLLDFKK